MKNFLRLVLTFVLCLSGTLQAFSQSEQEKQFISVWTPSKNPSAWGKIKISYNNGNLLFEIKSDEGLKKITNVTIVNGVLYAKIEEASEYGYWKIGNWNRERDHILVSHSGLSFYNYGTNGQATRIRSRSIATEERNFLEFKCVLDNGNLKLYHCYSAEYVDNHGTLLFSQSSDFMEADEYTNW